MELLVKATGKYDEIYTFKEDETRGDEFNAKLMEIFNKNKTVDEVFFYFSGHGHYDEEEFYYALQDYNSQKRNQTSLTNTSLDAFIKSVNPNKVVKIVDSCNSGINYIKQDGLVEKHFDISKQKFNDCYFLFSSRTDQSSYAGEYFSDFTKCFIDSILNSKTNLVRYKNIIDYVSDCFANNSKQKPVFITQGDFTLEFGSLESVTLDKIKEEVNKILPNSQEIVGCPEAFTETNSLKDLIIADNKKNYCTKEDADNFLQKLHDTIQNYQSSNDLRELYEYRFFESESDIDSQIKVQNIYKIAQIIENSSEDIFAKVLYKEVERNDVFMPWMKKTKKIPSSYEHTFNSPYYALRLLLYPKDGFNNIKPFDFTLVYLLTKNEITICYYYSKYKEYSWGLYKSYENINWMKLKFCLNNVDSMKQQINKILFDFEEFVIEELTKNFKKEME